MNPRLRAPLPSAAVALARRPPARDPEPRASTQRAMPSVPPFSETRSQEQRQNKQKSKKQAQAFLVRADFIAATRPLFARSAGSTPAPGARPPSPQLQLPCAGVARKVRRLPRRKTLGRRPTPVSHWGPERRFCHCCTVDGGVRATRSAVRRRRRGADVTRRGPASAREGHHAPYPGGPNREEPG